MNAKYFYNIILCSIVEELRAYLLWNTWNIFTFSFVPKDLLDYRFLYSQLKEVVRTFVEDDRCGVHQMLLGVRDEKEGWLNNYCPGNIACDDDGDLWSAMVNIKIMFSSSLLTSFTTWYIRDIPGSQAIHLHSIHSRRTSDYISRSSSPEGLVEQNTIGKPGKT